MDLYKSNKNRVSPLTIPRTMANAGASHISMEFGLTGPAYTVSTRVLLGGSCNRTGLLDGAFGRR